MKKTTFWFSTITLMFMGTLLFFVGLENSQDEMLPKGVRESFMVVSGFGLLVSLYGCICGVFSDTKHLV
jgi:hypothetical protein